MVSRSRPGAGTKSCALRSLAVLLFALAGPVFAQAQTGIRFRPITLDQGLPNYTVMAVSQDATGYMWFGTQIGLARHDGSHFRVYRASSVASDSLGDGFVTALVPVEQSPGDMWVGTKLGGVHHYLADRDAFVQIPGPHSPESRHILTLLDHRGRLFVGTDGFGLLGMGGSELTQLLPTSLTGRRVQALSPVPDEDHLVLIASELGLIGIDPNSNVATPVDIAGPVPPAPFAIAWASDGRRMFVGSPEGLFELTRSDGPFSYLSRRIENLASQDIRELMMLDGQLWVGFGDSGIQVLDQELNTVSRLAHDPLDATSVADDAIESLFADQSGTAWVGTWGKGLSVVRPTRRFSQIRHDAQNPNSPPSSNVFGILEDRSRPGTLWVGFLNGGLVHWDPGASQFRRFYQSPGHPLSSVSALEYDHSGVLWALGRRNSVFQLDEEGQILRRVPLDIQPDSANGWVTFLHPRTHDETLLIGTRGHGLLVFDPVQDSILRRYGRRAARAEHRLDSDDIWQLVEESNGSLWVATGLGLVRIDSLGDVVNQYTHDPMDARSLSGPLISSVVRDQSGFLWLGTPDAGLNRFDPETGTSERFSRADGLPSIDVGGIVQDHDGMLWLSSSAGLAVLDPTSFEIAHFEAEDGIVENVFQYRARTRLDSGQIAFGGPNGTLTLFDPGQIRIDRTPSQSVVSETLVGSRRERPGTQISVAFSDSEISFRFGSLQYGAPKKARFLVRLSPDEDWAPVSLPEVTYRRLAPDRYRFQVLASNADGILGNPSAPIELTVRPPFWQTWWFSLLVVTGIAGIIIGGFQYRIAHIRRLEAERNRIANDLHDDLGSKLGSLALRLDLMARRVPLEKESLSGLAAFSRIAIQNLRDTIWLVGTGHGTFGDVRDRLQHAANEILVAVAYRFKSEGGPMTREVDPLVRRAILLAFREALHNVVKHSNASHVEIMLSVSQRDVEVIVRDNGNGQIDRNGSGRGMHTLVERLESIGGTTVVDAELGVGTTVRLRARI
jgi:ligand-binding sensor domain-containing protein/signal transduction histidine kinase